MRFPPNLPILNRPLVRGNSITAYSDNANKFVNMQVLPSILSLVFSLTSSNCSPKIWLRYGRPSNIWFHMLIREGIIASAAFVSTKLPNSVSLTHFRCFQLLLVFSSSWWDFQDSKRHIHQVMRRRGLWYSSLLWVAFGLSSFTIWPRIGSDGHESYYTNEFLAKSALKNRLVIRQGLAK